MLRGKDRFVKMPMLVSMVLILAYITVPAAAEKGENKGKSAKGKGKVKRTAEPAESPDISEAEPVSVGEDRSESKKGKAYGKAKRLEDDVKAAKGSKSKGKQKKFANLRKQAAKFQAIHDRRVARLSRIRELATEKGDQKTIERVDRLLNKEDEKYAKREQRVERKMQALESEVDAAIDAEAGAAE